MRWFSFASECCDVSVYCTGSGPKPLSSCPLIRHLAPCPVDRLSRNYLFGPYSTRVIVTESCVFSSDRRTQTNCHGTICFGPTGPNTFAAKLCLFLFFLNRRAPEDLSRNIAFLCFICSLYVLFWIGGGGWGGEGHKTAKLCFVL